MKIKLDENIPRVAAELLTRHGHDVRTVIDEGSVSQPDDVIAGVALAEHGMIITLDRGFPAVANLPHFHSGIVVFRLADQSTPYFVRTLGDFLVHYSLESLRACLVIVSESQVRIRRPE